MRKVIKKDYFRPNKLTKENSVHIVHKRYDNKTVAAVFVIDMFYKNSIKYGDEKHKCIVLILNFYASTTKKKFLRIDL